MPWAGAGVSGPLQNRVTPTGEIVAVPARGLLMGNRGCLHGQGRTLGGTRWRSKLWICCVLDWQGRRRDPMPPGRCPAASAVASSRKNSAVHRPGGIGSRLRPCQSSTQQIHSFDRQRAVPSVRSGPCKHPRLPISVPRADTETISPVGVTRFCSD